MREKRRLCHHEVAKLRDGETMQVRQEAEEQQGEKPVHGRHTRQDLTS